MRFQATHIPRARKAHNRSSIGFDEGGNEPMVEHKDTVIVTGSTGFIGSALIDRFADQFALVGLDRAATHQPPPAAECVCIDLTSEEAIAAGLRRVRTAYGMRIASVVP